MAYGIPKTFQVLAESHFRGFRFPQKKSGPVFGLHTSLRVTETSWDSPKHREKLPVTPRGGCEIHPSWISGNLRRCLAPQKKTHTVRVFVHQKIGVPNLT